MSVNYDIIEHIIITDKCEDSEIRDDIRATITDHLIRISGAILHNNMWDCDIKLAADDKTIEFEGTTLTETFQTLFRTVKDAKSFELELRYHYVNYALYYLNPEPFKFTEYFDEVIKEEGPDALKGIFYSLYNNADCSDDAGIVVAYGEKNGRMCTGTIEPTKIESLPTGKWYASQTYLILEDEKMETINFEEIRQICTEMSKFSDDDELSIDENGMFFELMNLGFNNNTEWNNFLSLYNKLINATGSKVLTDEFDFAEISNSDSSVVKIRINDDGTADINCISTDL